MGATYMRMQPICEDIRYMCTVCCKIYINSFNYCAIRTQNEKSNAGMGFTDVKTNRPSTLVQLHQRRTVNTPGAAADNELSLLTDLNEIGNRTS